jgi:hypothetical protein
MSDAGAPPPATARFGGRPRGMALWWPVLLLALSLAILIGPALTEGALQLANPDRTRAAGVQAAFDALPDDALVLVALDADLGTYPEIRPAVRAALDELLSAGASLAFVSVSVEGRAIGVAEQARLRAAGAGEEPLDLGFVSGVEAGLVLLVGDALPAGASGAIADAVAEEGGGLAAFDMMLLVGGSDVGPRTWVEQVGTRLPEVPMVAIAPTFAEPELAPYLRTGQLVALLATVRDDAAFVESVVGPEAGPTSTGGPPSAAAMLLGMLVAVVVLGRALVQALPRLRRSTPRPAAEDDEA